MKQEGQCIRAWSFDLALSADTNFKHINLRELCFYSWPDRYKIVLAIKAAV